MALRESALCGTNSSKVQKGAPSWEIMIGIPGSKEHMNLEVYIPGIWRCYQLGKNVVLLIEPCFVLFTLLYITSVNTQYHRAVPSFRRTLSYCNRFRVFTDKDEQSFKLFDRKSQVE